MEEFKQLEIYLFPIVMLLAIGMNNWKREERRPDFRVSSVSDYLHDGQRCDVPCTAALCTSVYGAVCRVSGVLLLPDSSTVCLAFVCERKAFCAA